VTSFFGINGAFFAFFSKTTSESAPQFFLGFRRKHFIYTTCIEKQCTLTLSLLNILNISI